MIFNTHVRGLLDAEFSGHAQRYREAALEKQRNMWCSSFGSFFDALHKAYEKSFWLGEGVGVPTDAMVAVNQKKAELENAWNKISGFAATRDMDGLQEAVKAIGAAEAAVKEPQKLLTTDFGPCREPFGNRVRVMCDAFESNCGGTEGMEEWSSEGKC